MFILPITGVSVRSRRLKAPTLVSSVRSAHLPVLMNSVSLKRLTEKSLMVESLIKSNTSAAIVMKISTSPKQIPQWMPRVTCRVRKFLRAIEAISLKSLLKKFNTWMSHPSNSCPLLPVSSHSLSMTMLTEPSWVRTCNDKVFRCLFQTLHLLAPDSKPAWPATRVPLFARNQLEKSHQLPPARSLSPRTAHSLKEKRRLKKTVKMVSMSMSSGSSCARMQAHASIKKSSLRKAKPSRKVMLLPMVQTPKKVSSLSGAMCSSPSCLGTGITLRMLSSSPNGLSKRTSTHRYTSTSSKLAPEIRSLGLRKLRAISRISVKRPFSTLARMALFVLALK